MSEHGRPRVDTIKTKGYPSPKGGEDLLSRELREELGLDRPKPAEATSPSIPEIKPAEVVSPVEQTETTEPAEVIELSPAAPTVEAAAKPKETKGTETSRQPLAGIIADRSIPFESSKTVGGWGEVVKYALSRDMIKMKDDFTFEGNSDKGNEIADAINKRLMEDPTAAMDVQELSAQMAEVKTEQPKAAKTEAKRPKVEAADKPKAEKSNIELALELEETNIERFRNLLQSLESEFSELPAHERKVAQEIVELAGPDVETNVEAANLLKEIEKVRNEIKETESSINKYRLELTLNKLNIERGKHNLSDPELASRILDKDAKSYDILSLMPSLPSEMVTKLHRYIDAGAISLENGKLNATKNLDDESVSVSEARAFIADIEDFIKRDIAETFFKPGETELKFNDPKVRESVSALVNAVGEERDLDRILLLVKEGKVILRPDGELQPKPNDPAAEKVFNMFKDELLTRASAERAEEVERELKERTEKDPMLLELKGVIKEKQDLLDSLKERFEFESKKGLEARILSRIFKSPDYYEYLDHKSEMADLQNEIDYMKSLENDYVAEKNQMITELAKAQVEAVRGLTSFDCLNFDIDSIAPALAGARTGVELQTYKTPLAKKIIEEFDLREKMRQKGLKKAPKVSDVSEHSIDVIEGERKKVIEEKLRGNLESSFADILDHYNIHDAAEREKFVEMGFEAAYFRDYLNNYLEQEGTAIQTQQKIDDGSESAFLARFMAENISRIYNLEIHKGENFNSLLKFFEDKVCDARAEKRRSAMKKYAKSAFSFAVGGMDSGDIEADTTLKEIIEEGDSVRATVLKTAAWAGIGASAIPGRIGEVYYAISEKTMGHINRKVPDLEGITDRFYDAKAKRREANKKIKAKKALQAGWLSAIFGLGS